MERKGIGTAWLGWLVGMVGNNMVILGNSFGTIFIVIGIGMAVVGCVQWSQSKGRNGLFGIWGLLAPVGFLGVSLLKDKREGVESNNV